MTDPLPSLRETVARYGLTAKKALGQNFLFDANLTDKIAREAFARNKDAFENGTVIEIGPGPGGLTRSLLKLSPKHLIAVEKDERCLRIMEELQALYPRFDPWNADAMTVDTSTLGDAPRCVVSNLPYNIGTELLLKFLQKASCFTGFVLMFQKEVADRITAKAGDDAYGRLSVFANWLCETERVMTVNKSAFTPPPKVTSAVVALTPREKPLFPAKADLLERVTKAAFGQRRKMLRVSLKQIGDPQKLCDAANVSPMARPEDLPVEAFCAMARALEND